MGEVTLRPALLSELRGLIVATRTAAQGHGGEGALYRELRRPARAAAVGR